MSHEFLINLNGSSSNVAGPSHLMSNNSFEIFRQKIKSAEELKDFKRCLTISSQALKVSSEGSSEAKEFYLLRAKFLILTQQSNEASEILSGILKEEPRNAKAISMLGLVFYHQGNLKKSIEVFKNALQIDPLLVETVDLIRNAQKLLDITKTSQSIDKESPEKLKLIEEGLKIDPTNLEMKKKLIIQHGMTLFLRGSMITAIKDFTEVLKLNESNVEVFMFRAKSYIALSCFDDAMIDLLEADNLNANKCKKVDKEIEVLRRKIGRVYIEKTNYDTLEISRTANDHEIELSFKSLSLLHQININEASTSAEKRNFIFKFKRVENAFTILSDPTMKKKYDKILAEQEASIDCPNLTTCCITINNAYQCCCSGLGSCMHGFCTGCGSCMEGFFKGCGSCIAVSASGFIKHLNCEKIVLCIFISLILYALYKWI